MQDFFVTEYLYIVLVLLLLNTFQVYLVNDLHPFSTTVSHKCFSCCLILSDYIHTRWSKSFRFSSQRFGLCQHTMATLSHSTNLSTPLWHQQNKQIIDAERRRTERNQRVVQCGKQSNYTFLMSQWSGRKENGLCVCTHVDTVVIICFCCFPFS